MDRPKSFLIIQTAFIGDVILATALIEKLHTYYPEATIDFLVRKGNEGLLEGHPYLHEVIVFDKKRKYKNLLHIIQKIRRARYDVLINVQRYATTGIIAALSKAKQRIGFDKNPLAVFNTTTITHHAKDIHEVERNQKLIEVFTDRQTVKPKLYPSDSDWNFVQTYQQGKYLCMAPTSVWFTKQWPVEKWIELIQTVQKQVDFIYLLGAPADHHVCESIRLVTGTSKVVNLAGKLSFLQSVALIKGAKMNYVNDSAPMHLASSVNAPVTAIYCSTVPSFGFGPLSDQSVIIETREKLSCRPCGSHGFKECPQGHFKCAYSISTEQFA